MDFSAAIKRKYRIPRQNIDLLEKLAMAKIPLPKLKNKNSINFIESLAVQISNLIIKIREVLLLHCLKKGHRNKH